MITLKLQGGLGNQMFIYTFGKQLASLGYNVQLDASLYCNSRLTTEKDTTIRNLELLDFNITLPIVNTPSKHSLLNSIRRHVVTFFLQKSVLHENNINSLTQIPKKSYIDGYFAKSQYAESMLQELLVDFTPKNALSPTNQAWKEKIHATKNSVFVHIRRGDYLLPIHWEFVKLGQAYYNNAIKLIKKHIASPSFFIFSNDIEWCKNNIMLFDGLSNENTYFVEGNHEGNALEEMELMRSCKHEIMANSTFSWWVGFLLKNLDKICIFPTQFSYNPYNDETKNLIPSSDRWHLIDPIWGYENKLLFSTKT